MSTVPSWVADAIFYQIFPERFDNGDSTNDPPNCEPWGGIPKSNNYFGGDLRGIIHRLDYVSDLGITALYLNPIFSAESNHKYNTKDYFTIDPSFGSNNTFEELLHECHKRNIRVVIDGVFNHVGTAHFAFQDVKEKGRESKYVSWFNIYSFPVSEPRKPNYECWWGHGALPKLMVQNPEVKKYISDVTTFWTTKGIDGWRLDVANEIPHEFWKEWRTLVKSINPECYIVGELWEDASAWLQGDEFDATMNYRFRQACIDYFVHNSITAKTFFKHLEEVRRSCTAEHTYAMQNLLGSHDTERYLTLCKGELWRMKLSMMFQMTYIGAPMIYYGDEIGMEGGKDPDCRRCMVWDKRKWNEEMYSLTKQLISLRRKSNALRRGKFTAITEDIHEHVAVFSRMTDDEKIFVALNTDSRKHKISVNAGNGIQQLREYFSQQPILVNKGIFETTIPPHTGRIFTTI